MCSCGVLGRVNVLLLLVDRRKTVGAGYTYLLGVEVTMSCNLRVEITWNRIRGFVGERYLSRVNDGSGW